MAPNSSASNERIAALEVIVDDLRAEVYNINSKLDELLALRNKGLGAFWLGTTLAGIIGFSTISMIWDWLKSLAH